MNPWEMFAKQMLQTSLKDDTADALQYAFANMGHGRWTSHQATRDNTIELTDFHVHADNEPERLEVKEDANTGRNV